MTDLTEYVFEPLLDDGELVLSRGVSSYGKESLLSLTPSRKHPVPAVFRRLEHAYALRTELDRAWAALPIELVHRHGELKLLAEDPGGDLLAIHLDRPMEIMVFLRVAIGLAAALSRFHERGLIHKDVQPASFLVDPETGQAWLINFGIASLLPRDRQTSEPPEMIVGTLGYMAPEQTGRMNRSIDSRSDLYALGVTFYRMLSGELPFTATEPMEWIHCHVARQPTPLTEKLPAIPAQLSVIIMKLLAKTPEERYQTASGLEADLGRCLDALTARGTIDSFPPGENDLSERLLIPERLYGRESEVAAMLGAFDRVLTGSAPQLVLVSGCAGIGKSSVVNELHRVLVPRRGIFAAGKFDQFKRDIPYATMAMAFQTLIRKILVGSESEVDRWRKAMLTALGNSGQLIVDIIPDLGIIIGPQPSVPELSPAEAKSRFRALFREFIGVFAQPEHPFALFLDDLQWLDAGTLDLLGYIIAEHPVPYLLLVGAYRDDEVGPEHPLRATLDLIGRSESHVETIELLPLARKDVGLLLSDSLHSTPEQVMEIAEMVHEKTGGNPFFVIQFLTALCDDGQLAFDRAQARWSWELESIRARGYTDNVADLMTSRLDRLPPETRNAVQQLAALGNASAIATLGMIGGDPDEILHQRLEAAVRTGLVVRTGDRYSFLHDRVQEGAYALIPDDRKAAVHLGIARALYALAAPDRIEERIFEIVPQFNHGITAIDSEEERALVAELLLVAGRRARRATTFSLAAVYFSAGSDLLGEQGWESHYSLKQALEQSRAEFELDAGYLDTAGLRLEELILRSKTKPHLLEALAMKVQIHTMRSEYRLASESSRQCLRLHGIEMDEEPTRKGVEIACADVWRKMNGRSIESLLELPRTTDPEIELTVRLLSLSFHPASLFYRSKSWEYPCRIVSLALDHGSTPISFYGFGYFGLMLGAVFGRYTDGYRFCRLAIDLAERDNHPNHSSAFFMLAAASLWCRPLSESIEILRQAGSRAFDSRCTWVSCIVYCHLVANMLERGDRLGDVLKEAERGLAYIRRMNFQDIATDMAAKLRFIKSLQGTTSSFPELDDEELGEAGFEATLTPDRMPTTLFKYWVLKGEAQFIAGEFAAAAAAFDTAAPLHWMSTSFIQYLDWLYFSALTDAALYCHTAPDTLERLGRLKEQNAQLARWAESCADTFADKHALLSAEIARIEGRTMDAMKLYDSAIRMAHEQGFSQHEGIANEAAARFYASQGFETIALTYQRNARDCYLRWGALGKVGHLEKRYPQLREENGSSAVANMIGTPIEQLDVGTVIKASQALSGEIVLDRLIETLMAIAVEHAGAARGLLILPHHSGHRIEAEATTSRERVAVTLRQADVTSEELPESVLALVLRTATSVILDDASADPLFVEDTYIQSRYARSILCLPLVNQGRLRGVLYLENNLAPYVFTPDRVVLLQMLASQAAISLVNARLYTELEAVKEKLYNENIALREEVDKTSMFEEIVGTSSALRAVLSRVSKVAPTDSTVLITGETGTGKELVARAIHKRSGRSARAFVSVNCAAIPQSLIASELFGHERGAFTGALQRRIGRFELADGGTIFLDELGELPLETQIALLRVLQQQEFERVGGTQTIRTNVRVIAATNRDLQSAIDAGTFRSDLYYRLNVFPIEIPPLRERREDIPMLVEYFIDRYASKSGKKIVGVNRQSLELLQAYAWPGNIRELQNVIERSIVVGETENFSVDESWLSGESRRNKPAQSQSAVPALSARLVSEEKSLIEAALAETRGRVAGPSGAAAKLGIPSSTLESKIRALKINKYRFKSE